MTTLTLIACIAIAPSIAASEGALIPLPRDVRMDAEVVELAPPWVIETNAPDSPAVIDARQWLTRISGYHPPLVVARAADHPHKTVVRITWLPGDGEGYRLSLAHDGTRARTEIVGDGPAGAYYGLQTLKQRVRREADDLAAPACRITDEPSFAIRGIKGLYWAPRQYQEMMHWLPEHKFNFLMFCYSMYPETWSDWRRPFSAEQLAEMKRVVDHCQARYMQVCLSINPSLRAEPSLIYSSPADLEALVAKVRSAYDIGIRWFAICLDDIALGLVNEEDKAKFSSLGAAQVYFMRHLLARVQRIDADIQLIFCPTTYTTASVDGPEAEEYIRIIGRRMPRQIRVFWTGPVVCSPEITSTQADEFAQWIQRPPFIWDNYPVNDYCPDRLLMGPLRNRSADLHEHISGWISNPMMQSEASKVPLATLADYLWNSEAYDATRSYEAALSDLLAGPEREALATVAEPYTDFLDEEQRMLTTPDELARLANALQILRAAPACRRLCEDIEPIVGGWFWSVSRVPEPKPWSRAGVAFIGEELAGGAVDRYGRNPQGMGAVNWVYAQSTGMGTMTAHFVCDDVPAGGLTLRVEGADDDFETQCPIRISLNGNLVFEGESGFPDATHAWREFPIEPGWLLAGENVLAIDNTQPTGDSGWPPWFMVRHLDLTIP